MTFGTTLVIIVAYHFCQTTYKTLSNILLSRLTTYAEEITGNHQCRFRRHRSTTDHMFGIIEILEKNWEYNEAVHQLFTDLKLMIHFGGKSCTIFPLSLVSP